MSQENRRVRHLSTKMAQANGAIDRQTGGLVPAIQPSTTFARDEQYALYDEGHIYARDDNDLVRLGEQMLADAEQAADALIFPTGMAAIASLFRTVPNGATIIIQSQIYWGTTKWVREFAARRDIKLIELDASDAILLDSTIAHKRPYLVFVETPSNPWLRITDIAKASRACKAAGAILAVDSTAATPVLSNPLTLGADIVMHSATKAINGHSDVLAGVLATKEQDSAVWQAIKTDRHDAGAVIGSFEAWLLIRGMRTLPLRMERMSENAQAIAEHLNAHPKVQEVLYPGLENHAQHLLAKAQMPGGFGSLLSFLVKGDGDDALTVCGALELFKRATSLGGVESLVEHRHSIEGPDTGIPTSLIRLSVGIEHIDDLMADLDAALDRIG